MIWFEKNKVVVHPKGFLVVILSYNRNQIEWKSANVNEEGKILHGISYGLELEKFYDVFDKNEEK
jgi:hypothetical protein